MNRLPASRLLQHYLRLTAALHPERRLALADAASGGHAAEPEPARAASAGRLNLCYRCETLSEWRDDGFRYRCTHCGADPLERAPEG